MSLELNVEIRYRFGGYDLTSDIMVAINSRKACRFKSTFLHWDAETELPVWLSQIAASNFIHQSLKTSAHTILLANMTIRLSCTVHDVCTSPAACLLPPWWSQYNVWFSHVAILWHILKHDSAHTFTCMHLIRLDWYIILNIVAEILKECKCARIDPTVVVAQRQCIRLPKGKRKNEW